MSGFLDADGVTAAYSRTAGETVAASPYSISAALSPAGVLGNYNITYNTANFTITQASTVTSLTTSGRPVPVWRAGNFHGNGDLPVVCPPSRAAQRNGSVL